MLHKIENKITIDFADKKKTWVSKKSKITTRIDIIIQYDRFLEYWWHRFGISKKNLIIRARSWINIEAKRCHVLSITPYEKLVLLAVISANTRYQIHLTILWSKVRVASICLMDWSILSYDFRFSIDTCVTHLWYPYLHLSLTVMSQFYEIRTCICISTLRSFFGLHYIPQVYIHFIQLELLGLFTSNIYCYCEFQSCNYFNR